MWKIEGIQVSVVIHMAVRQYSMIYTHYVTYKAVSLGKHQQVDDRNAERIMRTEILDRFVIKSLPTDVPVIS